MADEALTDEEWIIRSINIHGTFFQRWCENVVRDTSPWTVKATELPVAYPPLMHALPSNESALDILAELKVGEGIISLLIECKKSNPDFVNWVFFPRESNANTAPMRHKRFDIVG